MYTKRPPNRIDLAVFLLWCSRYSLCRERD
nr:MAG TPA: hypothetical protein [Caudoviricetes sp.]